MKKFAPSFLVAITAVWLSGGSAAVPAPAAAGPAGSDPTIAGPQIPVRQRAVGFATAADEPAAEVGDVTFLAPKAVSDGGFWVLAKYPPGCELAFEFSPAAREGQFYYQQVSESQRYVVFLYPPPAEGQTVTVRALKVTEGRDIDARGSVTVAREGAPAPKPDDGKKPSPPPTPRPDGTAGVAFDAAKVYARLLGDLHADAKGEIDGQRIKSKADFDKFMERTAAARTEAFRKLMEAADRELPAGSWRESDFTQAAAFCEDAAAGFRKAGE